MKDGNKVFTEIKNQDGQTLFVEEATFNIVERLIFDANSNILLYGDKGTAKTELGWAVLNKHILPIFQAELGAISSGDQLDGERSIDTTGALVNIPTEFLLGLQNAASGVQTGLILDEINRVQAPAALNKLLRLFSSQREYATDLAGVLKIGKGMLRTIATANIGYQGTVKLNEALLDRFDAIGVTPIGGKVLVAMLEERFPMLTSAPLSKIVKFVDQTRRAFEKDPDGTVTPLSTRDAQRIAKGMSIGMTAIEAVTVLVGGQIAIQQLPDENIDALVADAKAQLVV